MDPHVIVREFFPDADWDRCENIIATKTSYPYCTSDGRFTLEKFRDELEKYSVALKIGYDVCNLCRKIRHDLYSGLCPICLHETRKGIERVHLNQANII